MTRRTEPNSQGKRPCSLPHSPWQAYNELWNSVAWAMQGRGKLRLAKRLLGCHGRGTWYKVGRYHRWQR